MNKQDAIEWFIRRFVRQKGPANWMRRRHGLDKPVSKDVQRKISTTDRRRYFDYDIDFCLEGNTIMVNALTAGASWANGYITIQGDTYVYRSLPQRTMFKDLDKPQE